MNWIGFAVVALVFWLMTDPYSLGVSIGIVSRVTSEIMTATPEELREVRLWRDEQ